MGFGHKKDWTHNAKGSSAWQGKTIAVAVSYIIHTAWLREPKIAPGRIHYLSRSHLWFLSQIPLRAQFYWVVLGSCEADLQEHPEDKGHEGNGRERENFPWQRAHCPNPTVSFFLHMPLIILSPISYANRGSGGGLGKPKISRPSDIASRDGYKAKKRAQ